MATLYNLLLENSTRMAWPKEGMFALSNFEEVNIFTKWLIFRVIRKQLWPYTVQIRNNRIQNDPKKNDKKVTDLHFTRFTVFSRIQFMYKKNDGLLKIVRGPIHICFILYHAIEGLWLKTYCICLVGFQIFTIIEIDCQFAFYFPFT